MTKHKSSSPKEHYEREKARRSKNPAPESDLMAAARREYEALLAAQSTKGKGGRPRKQVPKPKKDDALDLLPDSEPDDADSAEGHAEEGEAAAEE
jgi:hypothetical protein